MEIILRNHNANFEIIGVKGLLMKPFATGEEVQQCIFVRVSHPPVSSLGSMAEQP